MDIMLVFQDNHDCHICASAHADAINRQHNHIWGSAHALCDCDGNHILFMRLIVISFIATWDRLHFLASYLAELALPEYAALQFLPSQVGFQLFCCIARLSPQLIPCWRRLSDSPAY